MLRLTPEARGSAFGNLAAAGQVAADQQGRDAEAGGEAQLRPVAVAHQVGQRADHDLADCAVHHLPSSSSDALRILCAIRLCSVNSSMKTGLAACEISLPNCT